MVWVLHVVNKPCMNELHACIYGPTTTIRVDHSEHFDVHAVVVRSFI
jgi:hypothetical protein